FCAALDINTRRVLGYSLDTHQDAQLVKDTIQQVKSVYSNHKKFYFIVIKDSSLPAIPLLIFVTNKKFNKVCPVRETVGITL
ncbi:hypothetical protein P4283_15570, partial [Bacillus thuringiensis]|nr:hypothetical protein [Bacillus thuringiensis]